jgi:hypothetical protein
MLKPVILDVDTHSNGNAMPFRVAIVDDPNDGETKLVVMFDTPGHIAVLSLDCLINEEDVSSKCHGSHGDKLEDAIRELLEDGKR